MSNVEQPHFLDANVLIRHIAGDHETHSPAARALLREIELERLRVWTTDLVIGEVVYVLGSKHSYNLSREEIRSNVLALLNLPGIDLENKSVYNRAFELFVRFPIDFPDAFHAALIEHRGESELHSFDRDFDRIAGLKRHEPLSPTEDFS